MSDTEFIAWFTDHFNALTAEHREMLTAYLDDLEAEQSTNPTL